MLLNKKGVRTRFKERAFLTMLLSSLRQESKFNPEEILYKYSKENLKLTKKNINKIRVKLLQEQGKRKPVLKETLQIKRIYEKITT